MLLNERKQGSPRILDGSGRFGDVSGRRGATKDSERTRNGIVRRFRESHGSNVLILSPDVAGVGLTLTEANHVIHYGRWWNPAKEAQATDRVYRIGQRRDVHVYPPSPGTRSAPSNPSMRSWMH